MTQSRHSRRHTLSDSEIQPNLEGVLNRIEDVVRRSAEQARNREHEQRNSALSDIYQPEHSPQAEIHRAQAQQAEQALADIQRMREAAPHNLNEDLEVLQETHEGQFALRQAASILQAMTQSNVSEDTNGGK